MANVITKRVRISRRTLLQGLALPPLVSMFNSTGQRLAYKAPRFRVCSRVSPHLLMCSGVFGENANAICAPVRRVAPS